MSSKNFKIAESIMSKLKCKEIPAIMNKDEEVHEPFPMELAINQSNHYVNETAFLDENNVNLENQILNENYTKPSPEINNMNSDSEDDSRNIVDIKTSYPFWHPMGWVKQKENPIEDIELNILKGIKTPLKRYYVYIRNRSLKIWTISANTQSNKIPIVLVHGFCGAVALWAHNIDALSESRPFYAFDLLGFGRSSRPPFSSDPHVAEGQFVESIEDWRKAVGIKEMILLGHSFGGYLSTAYTIKYPQYIKSLILADPWGFPDRTSDEKPDTPMPLWISIIAKASQYVSPLGIFRATGQVGVSLFKHLRPDFKRKYMNVVDNPEIIYSYLYYANNLHPSGEAGFRAVAEYFGFAKNPMIKRVDKIKTHIPIFFVYGSRSWIDCTSGFIAVYIRQQFPQVAPISVEIISGAGHHVYADKPNEFNEYIKYLLETIDDNQDSYQHNQNNIIRENPNSLMNCN